ICPEDDSGIVDRVYRNGNISNTDDTPAYQHDRHGNCRLSCTSWNTCHTVRKCQEKIEKSYCMCLGSSVGDYLRRMVKAGNQVWRKNINYYAHQLCNGE